LAVLLAVLLLCAIAAIVFACRGSSDRALPAEPGGPQALADYLDRLQRSTDPHAFLIVADPQSGDFVQFTASSEVIQINFPVITPRQQELEFRVRQVLEANGLRPASTAGSDGSRFLDADSSASPEETAEIIRSIFRDAFGRLPDSLHYQSDGLAPHAG
jgi:hypothetical protein